MKIGRVALALSCVLSYCAALHSMGQRSVEWHQWGGPSRDFTVQSGRLAERWPSSGPRKLWSRSLGQGQSSVLVAGSSLYTMYRPSTNSQPRRPGQEESIVSLDASTGQVLWEFRYPAPADGMDVSQGAVPPHATPLVLGDRLYATSSQRQLFALDRVTGRRLWNRDLVSEYSAPRPRELGYACSPLAYQGRIIVTTGIEKNAVMAFDAKTGALAWKGGEFAPGPASPIVIDVDGQPQLVVFGRDRVVGMDPGNGRPHWSHPHPNNVGLNVSTPLWLSDRHLLLVSAAYDAGTRALELRQIGGRTTVTERWFTRRLRIHFGTMLRVGDLAIGSSGDFGPAFLTAVDLDSGTVAWQDRGFARAQLLHADAKLLILDEDGVLALATVTPRGLTVLSRAQIADSVSWTPPTLVGTRLYVRDRETIAAFELGPQ